MIYLTDDEKHRIFEGVKPMLTEWAGGVNLVPTSCYGVRLVRGCMRHVCKPALRLTLYGAL